MVDLWRPKRALQRQAHTVVGAHLRRGCVNSLPLCILAQASASGIRCRLPHLAYKFFVNGSPVQVDRGGVPFPFTTASAENEQAGRCSESRCLGADLCGGLFDGLIRADQLPALAALHQFAPALPLDLCREAGKFCFASEPSYRDPVTSYLMSTFLRYTFPWAHLAGVDGGPLPGGLVPFS